MASEESTSLNIEKTSNNLDNLQKNSEQPTKKTNLNKHQRKKRREAKMAINANEPPPSFDPQNALVSQV
uniref:Uncharacterized protein n=1 Tax=Meloidogyne javanica TaxID=6303 RepID=A0A915MB78_MELJA